MAPEVSSSLASSARHRVRTRLRLIRMRPRRARFVRELVASAPSRSAPTVAEGRAGGRRVLVIAHVYYPELWDELAEGIAQIPGEVDRRRHARGGACGAPGRAHPVAVPRRRRAGAGQSGPRRVAVAPGARPGAGPRRGPQGAHQAVPAHAQRGRLAAGASRRPRRVHGSGSRRSSGSWPPIGGSGWWPRHATSSGREFLGANRARVEALARKGGRSLRPRSALVRRRVHVLGPTRGASAACRPWPRRGRTSARRRVQSTGPWRTRSSATSESWRRTEGLAVIEVPGRRTAACEPVSPTRM